MYLNEFIQQMSDDIPFLRDAVMDIIRAIDRFIESQDPSIDFQPIVFKLDFLQRIAVNLDVDVDDRTSWTCLQYVG